jgi:glycosyltransferase involved in cell wall biosynthesis
MNSHEDRERRGVDGDKIVEQADRENHTTPHTRRLRILHIVLSIGETNSTYNEHCLPMAGQRDITLCTYFKSPIAVPPAITIFEGDGSLAGFLRALRMALRAKTYDVIHAHTPHVAFLFQVATFLSGRRSLPLAIVTVHDSYPNYKIRNRLLFLPVFARFARVVCCSRSSFNSFPGLYRWLAGDRLGAVPNGLDIARVDRIAAAGKHRRERGDFNVVAISRLVKIKNPFTVLGAFRAGTNRGSHLTYIGDGPLRRSLLTMCSKDGLDGQVTFTGMLPREKVFERVLGADLFVSASRGEGLPVAVLETMACGCPVVLSDIPPHREIVGNVDFIPLIRPDDETGFKREIESFQNMAPSDRARIGALCRSLVAERFSLEAMHAGYDAIYTAISPRPHGRSPFVAEVAHDS